MMNYDLAMMALEGLGKSPLRIQVSEGLVRIEGASGGFKELARLCLLLGSENVAHGEGFELKSPLHLAKDSPGLVLTLTS